MTLSTVERVRAPSGVEGLALGGYGVVAGLTGGGCNAFSTAAVRQR